MNISLLHPTTTFSRDPVTSQVSADNAKSSANISRGGEIDVSGGGSLISTSSRQDLLNLGRIAIGSGSIDKWSGKGFNVSEESLVAAAKALQDGFKQVVDKQGSQTAGSLVSINKHQIIINEQRQVPEWFIKEYDNALAMLDDPAQQQAFKNGALFYASPPAATDLKSSVYQTVAQYR